MSTGQPSSSSKPSSGPGSIRPVYGAKYPPINPAVHATAAKSISSENNNGEHKKADKDNAFAKTDDAWAADDMSEELVSATANMVLAQHANGAAGYNDTMMNVGGGGSQTHRFNRQQALQRLATQREYAQPASTRAPPTSVAPSSSQNSALYPRLTPVPSSSSKKVGEYRQRCVTSSDTSSSSPSSTTAVVDNRLERLERLLDNEDATPLDELKTLCWKGIPHRLRPNAWRLLSGYVPSHKARRASTLQTKRDEYWTYVEQYFCARFDAVHEKTFRQISIDIPRMCPLIPLFQQKTVQEMFERILFIWSLRHPASSYVQGINDLVTPYFVVFLSEHIVDDAAVGTFDVAKLDRTLMQQVEADSFWCVSSLLDCIQDNYTFSMPGVQRKVHRLQSLLTRIDYNLHTHLVGHEVEYLQFTFRWMNNLLMRELPLRATIRLWDTYMVRLLDGSESNGFADFHVYVCAAFIRVFSRQIQACVDFQSIMMFIQNLPTQQWSDQHISELCADAFALKAVFSGAHNHFA